MEQTVVVVRHVGLFELRILLPIGARVDDAEGLAHGSCDQLERLPVLHDGKLPALIVHAARRIGRASEDRFQVLVRDLSVGKLSNAPAGKNRVNRVHKIISFFSGGTAAFRPRPQFFHS